MRLLVFTAHPDDEIACLGMIEKAKKEGEVLLICFTSQNETRIKEFNSACEFLEIKGINLGLEDGMLTITGAIRKKLIDMIKEFKPDVVMCHSDEDYHPDHKKVNAIARDVVEFSRQNAKPEWELKEFMIWDSTNLFTNPHFTLGFEEDVMDKKKKLWDIHSSQTSNDRDKKYYLNFLEYKSRLRGAQIREKYGESYKKIPLVINGDFY